MSQRKILIAKRHDQRPIQRSSQNTPSTPTPKAQKRGLESEDSEPASKRKNVSNNNTSPTSKNLAAKRLQNLRNSLEVQRRLSESGQSPMAINTPPKINSPIGERHKRKSSCLLATASPQVSQSTSEKNHVSSILISTNKSFISNVSNVANVSASEKIDEGMDWTDIDDKAVVNDVIDLRKEINYDCKNLQIAKDLDNSACFRSDGVFVVVDTNIFLSHLMVLSDLKGKHIVGLGAVTVVVPWMVLQELDYMKDSHGSRISKAARKAVNYIHSLLQVKDPYFTGQTVMDAAKSEMSSSNPDDGIVFSCLQLVQRGKQTVLLSNDTNLRNKALIHGIRSYTHTDITSLTSTSHTSPNHSVAKLKLLLSNLLTHIVSSELQEAYGAVWSRMGGPQPPFTTEEALNVMKKYWVAVFGFQLQKQARGKMDEFGDFLKRHPNDANFNSETFNKFIELTLSLCIYLKNGYAKYREMVVECISNIQKYAES